MQFQLLHLYENISQRVFILKSDSMYAFRSDIYFPDLILDFFWLLFSWIFSWSLPKSQLESVGPNQNEAVLKISTEIHLL